MTTNPEIELASIQHVVIERAIKLLKAAKACYAIQLPDGSVVGELPVVIKPQRVKINNWVAMFPGYIDTIKNMEVGDVLSWTLDSNDQAKAFRAAVSSQGSHYLGNENTTTYVNDCTVEIMRTE